jgi:hypothetical protein
MPQFKEHETASKTRYKVLKLGPLIYYSSLIYLVPKGVTIYTNYVIRESKHIHIHKLLLGSSLLET